MAAENTVRFTGEFQAFLDSSSSCPTETARQLLMAMDPYEIAEKLEGGDAMKSVDLYLRLHMVEVILLVIPK